MATLVSGVSLFRSRDDIIDDLISGLQLRIPDIYTGEDGVVRVLVEVMAGVVESVFTSLEIEHQELFIQTASEDTLDRRGDEYGLPRLQGLAATGTIRFSGEGGTNVPAGTEIAYDPGTGEDYLYYLTDGLVTIPNPGTPTAPALADGGAGVMAAGSYEYVVTFVTAAGETVPGPESAPIAIVLNHKINLTAIPIGGPGTISRNLYESVNGAAYTKVTDATVVAAINNNVATTAIVNGGTRGAAPPAASTAEAISTTATAEEAGADYNVLAGTITVLTNAPDGVTTVTNPAPFVNGTDPEGFEDYRLRLIQTLRNPQVGSQADIKSWAEAVDGVDNATVYMNDNLGVATPGHVTIRIAGPNGTVPSAAVIASVLSTIQARDLANVTIHVTTFTATSTDVTITTTLQAGYVLADVQPSAVAAIQDYINNLAVGETFRVAGTYAAVFGLPGIVDLVVNTPATNQATGSTAKRVPGVITVN
jgi:uncharacterized phage protein gp47/JayE